MTSVTIELAEADFNELHRAAALAGQTAGELAALLISQALDPWARAWPIVERARAKARLEADEADQLAVAEVRALRRERRESA